MRWVMAGVLRSAALTALYLAFVGQFPLAEVTAGLLAGALAMALSLLLRRRAEQPFRLRAPWHRLVPRLAWSVLRDANKVAVALAKAVFVGHTGMIASQPIAEAGEGAAGTGRRALAILLASVAPNGYVIEPRHRALALHRLAKAEPAADRHWAL